MNANSKNWRSNGGQWWANAVAKAQEPDAEHQPMPVHLVESETVPALAQLRLDRAVARCESFRCRALIAVKKITP